MLTTSKPGLKDGFQNSYYIRERFRSFANRESDLNPERIYEIAKSIFTDNYDDFFKLLIKKSSHDPMVVIQLLTYVIAHTVKRARLIDTGILESLKMSFNLITMNIGDPGVGKSEITHKLFNPIIKRQTEECKKYMKAREKYTDDMVKFKKSRESKNSEIIKRFGCPDMVNHYIQNATMKTVFEKCQRNPCGILWHLDEFGPEQLAIGSVSPKHSKYGESLITGYYGKSVMLDKKSQNDFEQLCVDPFNLSISANVHTGMLKKIICKKNMNVEDKLLQIITPVIFPPRPEGMCHLPIYDYSEDEEKIFDYYEKIILKLLDLNTTAYPEIGERLFKEICVTDEACEYYNNWFQSFTKHCSVNAVMQAIVARIAEKVVKVAGCFHYLHLADKCVKQEIANKEYNINSLVHIADIEGEIVAIELIDMQRATAFADIMIESQEQFLEIL